MRGWWRSLRWLCGEVSGAVRLLCLRFCRLKERKAEKILVISVPGCSYGIQLFFYYFVTDLMFERWRCLAVRFEIRGSFRTT